MFLDLFDRSEKGEGGHQLTMIPAIKDDCDIHCAAATLIATNFVKSRSASPTLLSPDDLKTLFHEFGHAFHALFGATEFVDWSGTNVNREFLEMPSQFLEYFVYHVGVLQRISKHWKTDEILPSNMAQDYVASEKFLRSSLAQRQCLLSLIALKLSAMQDGDSIENIIKTLYIQLRPHIAYESEYHFESILSHIVNYGSHYYTYVWSEMVAANVFQHCLDNQGELKNLGRELYDTVLKFGRKKDMNLLVEDFLHTKIQQDPYLRMM
jgi:Zn-dependent oligopeptidase